VRSCVPLPGSNLGYPPKPCKSECVKPRIRALISAVWQFGSPTSADFPLMGWPSRCVFRSKLSGSGSHSTTSKGPKL
jgi:hypothetical protein